MDQATCLFISYKSWQKHGARSSALCGRLIPLFDAWLVDASGSASSHFWSICFMRFRMRCNLKTAPNIGEVSLVSAICPLLEWNVLVFPMASRRSRAPQTSGPYALCHPFPPTSDAPGRQCWGASGQFFQRHVLKCDAYITYCMHAHSFKAALITFLVTSCLN